jgi:hypothetical protein
LQFNEPELDLTLNYLAEECFESPYSARTRRHPPHRLRQSILSKFQNFKIPFKGAQTKPKKVAHGSPVYTTKLSFNENEAKDNSAAEFVDSILRSVYFLRFCNKGLMGLMYIYKVVEFSAVAEWCVISIYPHRSKRQAYTFLWL